MFCPNCGKTIDDNATFCGFCGTPTGVVQSAPVAEQPAQPVIPQNPVPQNTVPQFTAPQNPVPQGSVPPYAPAQQQQKPAGSSGISLDAKTINIINKSLCGALMFLCVLIIIGAIGAMATAGSISSHYKLGTLVRSLSFLQERTFCNLARVPSILAFVFSIGGLVFNILTKQRSLFSYIYAGCGLLLFIFNFVMYGGYILLRTSINILPYYYSPLSGGVSIAGIIVSGIFLLLSALAMTAASLVIILNKEDIIKFKPKY